MIFSTPFQGASVRNATFTANSLDSLYQFVYRSSIPSRRGSLDRLPSVYEGRLENPYTQAVYRHVILYTGSLRALEGR